MSASSSSATSLRDQHFLDSETFNRFAGQKSYPFLITQKLDDPARLTPDHLEFFNAAAKAKYVADRHFTADFCKVYTDFVELKRKECVALSLEECRMVRIETDFSRGPWLEQLMIHHLKIVARKIDLLFMKQKGTEKYILEVESQREADPLSHRLFWKNLSPEAMLGDPFDNALPSFPKERVAVYPDDVKLDEAFFSSIKNDKELTHPWTVVTRDAHGELKAVRYHKYYKKEMKGIAEELEFAASTIYDDPSEQALYEYLQAAAHAFRTGEWDHADKKWVAMNMENSKYALRVAPDETYWDPANYKAGFAFWLALIDKEAAKFSRQIAPFVQEMETEIHTLVPAYPPCKVNFDLPDFIKLIYAGGEHRRALGAIIGQKLPNFSDSHSRMVVMTNYYNDKDSKRQSKEIANLLFVDEIADRYEQEQLIGTTNTLLHEITHSLGVRASNFDVRYPDGSQKLSEAGEPIKAIDALGGHNTQVMEELKAQTGGLYWIGWLASRGVISKEMVIKLYVEAIKWAFDIVSDEMVNADESPDVYSQLAGIQIRHFLNTGALTLEDGKFRIHYELMHASIKSLFKKVIEIQVYGDAETANALRADIVDGEGFKAIQVSRVKAFYDRFPQTSFTHHLKGI